MILETMRAGLSLFLIEPAIVCIVNKKCGGEVNNEYYRSHFRSLTLPFLH